MNLPAELHLALARLDAELGVVRQTLQEWVKSCFPQQADGLALAQYRALEAVIELRQDVAAAPAGDEATPCAEPAPAAVNDIPLGIGRWWLREDGWTLAVPGSSAALPLSSDERSILLHLAQSPSHRISRDDMNRVLDLNATSRSGEAANTQFHARVINRLRRRVRTIGPPLPLRAIRGWGWQLARTELKAPRAHTPPAVASKVPQGRPAPAHRMEMEIAL